MVLDIDVDDDYDYECSSLPYGSIVTIDGGITLTSRAVRAETLPVLRESLSLRCEVSAKYRLYSPVSEGGILGIKGEYLKLIKKAEIKFSDAITIDRDHANTGLTIYGTKQGIIDTMICCSWDRLHQESSELGVKGFVSTLCQLLLVDPSNLVNPQRLLKVKCTCHINDKVIGDQYVCQKHVSSTRRTTLTESRTSNSTGKQKRSSKADRKLKRACAGPTLFRAFDLKRRMRFILGEALSSGTSPPHGKTTT